ncbi:MAG: RagB/SusD family nutrient uptake outer membrane protein [Tannerella sp.]|nr:RagB/SusD family nutrient uptake outer membrane protein [Tannerella sp.]
MQIFINHANLPVVQTVLFIISLCTLNACDYLDVVPDNIPTIEENFNMRVSAERYLFTCYRHLPLHGDISSDPAISSGDEYWYLYPYITTTSANAATSIARGLQNATSPHLDFWNVSVGGSNPFQGIRDCNIFMENIGRVPDMEEDEKKRWSAEAKFLKAYYHFWLLRMYGPIPLVKENLPVSTGVNDVKVYRQPVDDCVEYIVQLLDEAALDLPERIDFEATELGRITQPICLSLKALVLVTAASPLFNGGSTDYANIADNRGVRLFNSTPNPDKWIQAVEACAQATTLCDLHFKLYTFQGGNIGQTALSDSTKILIAIRNAVTEKWNGEVIWANTQSTGTSPQYNATPPGVMLSKVPGSLGNQQTLGKYSPPIKIAEMFYTRNGLPIDEDKTWDYGGRFNFRTAIDAERYYLQSGYTTIGLHFDREPRFYAALAFDGGLWFGQGVHDDKDQYLIQCKAEQLQIPATTARTNVTGYWPKKLVNHDSQPAQTGNGYNLKLYPWPVIRLADLYLLYAEALNEAYGPQGDPNATDDKTSPYTWLNKVRIRAGIPTIGETWDNYAINPNKYKQQGTLREIIQRERLIELAFEGHRFWDLRRWRLAHIELNKPVTGWDYQQKSNEYYYRQKVLYNQSFMIRDYFWPVRESELLVNRNLVQNYGY